MTDHRIGIGYDVHKLVPGRKLIIGGVDVPAKFGALGYSDADVLIHSIADALLGATALGDIGIHFPGTDLRNKGISGTSLLSRVVSLVKQKGFTVINIDSTIILQSPRVVEYIPQMKANIAEILDVNTDQVSVKATTTDKLGFAGRGEGIGAEAIALLKKN